MRADAALDDTIKLVRPPPLRQQRGGVLWGGAAALGALLVGAFAGWMMWSSRQAVPPPMPLRPQTTQSVPGQPQVVPAVPQAMQPAPAQQTGAAAIPIETGDEAQIRADIPVGLTVFRFAPDPSIVVLDFASLHDQGMMLNRIAALTEKGATPRNRVLNDAELDAAIRAGGDTPDTYYYGHDYSAAEMTRFFRLADEDGIALNPQEKVLQRLLGQLGWLAPGAMGGVITLPKVGTDAAVTTEARAAILRHELAHGEYFSNRSYAAYVQKFWDESLTERERERIRDFLKSEEYDPNEPDLIRNEMQAYLMFTHNPVFFTPDKVGMTVERLTRLQTEFYRGMPPGWLRDALGETLGTVAVSR